jgi:hypothetical protein
MDPGSDLRGANKLERTKNKETKKPKKRKHEDLVWYPDFTHTLAQDQCKTAGYEKN